MITINIHSSLTRFTDNQQHIELIVENTSQIVPRLCEQFAKLKANILDSQGELIPFVNVYVNGKNLKQLNDAPLHPGDSVDLVTALVGG